MRRLQPSLLGLAIFAAMCAVVWVAVTPAAAQAFLVGGLATQLALVLRARRRRAAEPITPSPGPVPPSSEVRLNGEVIGRMSFRGTIADGVPARSMVVPPDKYEGESFVVVVLSAAGATQEQADEALLRLLPDVHGLVADRGVRVVASGAKQVLAVRLWLLSRGLKIARG